MNKKNLFLIVGFVLPLAIVFLVAVSTYLPSFFYHPKYNFIYALDRQYFSNQYSVENGKIVIQKNPNYARENDISSEAQLFFYDVAHDQGIAMSFPQVYAMSLDPNPISPDQYQVVFPRESGAVIFPFFLMGDDSNSGIYLKGHGGSHKLNIGFYQAYSSGFHFVGWVVNGK